MVVMMVAATVVFGQARDPGPPGASVVFTSRDPMAVEFRGLLAEGRLADADRLLSRAEDRSDSEAPRLIEEGREIIRRTRREYDLGLDKLVARLKESIPDVTADDVERWRQAGDVQWRMIDGHVSYFRREPANIFRFCDEARRRRDEHAARTATPGATRPSAEPNADARLHEHLRQVIAAADTSGQTQVVPIKHHVDYKLTVLANRPGAKAGSQVRCWLPFPQEYRQQQGVKLLRTVPAEHVVAPNVVDGPRLGGAPQRTVYLEQRIDDPGKPVVFEESFEYVSHAYYPRISEAEARPLPADYAGGHLGERPPHIVFTPELIRTVEQVIGQETNPLAKPRRLFHFIDEHIRYCSELEYAVIPSLSTQGLTSRRGDCGIQGILFITMCRATGIPARWQSGFETKPGSWNMHDWTEFYVEPWGWLPADPSYGLMKSDDPKVREFYFGHQDAYRLIVDLDYGSPLHPPKPSLRSEPADFQRGEVEIDGRNLYFDEWEWQFTPTLHAATLGS